MKQKSEYDMRISEGGSDVCSSDLVGFGDAGLDLAHHVGTAFGPVVVFEHLAVAAEAPAGDFGDSLGVAAGRAGAAAGHARAAALRFFRSEDRRVGKACVSTC